MDISDIFEIVSQIYANLEDQERMNKKCGSMPGDKRNNSLRTPGKGEERRREAVTQFARRRHLLHNPKMRREW